MRDGTWLERALLVALLASCSSTEDPGAPSGSAAAPSGGQLGAATAGTGAGGAGGALSQGGTPVSNAGNGVDGGAGTTSSGGVISAAAGGTSAAGGSMAGAGAAGNSAGAGGAAGAANGVDPKLLIFLLLGQSNMVGQPQPQSQDLQQDPRIKVLAYDNCANENRQYNQWYTASPPLHQCDAGVGPADYFSKTLLESLPAGYTIGLVPCGVNGAPIDLFVKGKARTGYMLPPDNHWTTGYEWIVSRAREAQKSGNIAGFLFHQGESDREQPAWVGKVQGLVSDLRSDLGVGDVPFLAGELYYDGCCKAHNALVKQVTASVPNGVLISASGLKGVDQYHFDLAGQRELGKRYGTAMQGVLKLP
jgi:hypothetical protein